MEILKGVTELVDVLGVKDLVQLGASLTQQGIDAGSKAYAKRAEEKDALVEIAEVFSEDYRLKLDDAKRWLEEDGLRAEGVVVQPSIEYKDCSEFEVVASNYKLGNKVAPGTRIILKYVTAEVIKASQRLFEESEQEKEKNSQKKTENAVKNKQALDKTITNVQSGFSNLVTSTKKGIKGLLSKDESDN